MEDENRNLRSLDLSKIKHSGKVISSEEALKDVIPIDWPEEVLRGEKKIVVDGEPSDGLFLFKWKMEEEYMEDLESYMSKNYRIEIVKDELEDGYAAQYPELKGCVTCAEDILSLFEMLEDAKREWLTAALEDSYPIPEPDSGEFYISYRGHTGNIEFTEEDQVFYGKLIGIRDSVSYEGENIALLAVDFVEAVDDYLESLNADESVEAIVSADDGEPAIEVAGIRPMDDYMLCVEFSNGDVKIFDMKPLLDTPAFIPLKDKLAFESVCIEHGISVWSGGDIDIAPEKLYEQGFPEYTDGKEKPDDIKGTL